QGPTPQRYGQWPLAGVAAGGGGRFPLKRPRPDLPAVKAQLTPEYHHAVAVVQAADDVFGAQVQLPYHGKLDLFVLSPFAISGIFAHGQRVIAVSRAHKQVVVVYAVMFKPRLSYSALAFATTGQNDGGVFMAFLPHAQKRGGRVVQRVMHTRVKVGFP